MVRRNTGCRARVKSMIPPIDTSVGKANAENPGTGQWSHAVRADRYRSSTFHRLNRDSPEQQRDPTKRRQQFYERRRLR